jgi:hypothetical protein
MKRLITFITTVILFFGMAVGNATASTVVGTTVTEYYQQGDSEYFIEFVLDTNIADIETLVVGVNPNAPGLKNAFINRSSYFAPPDYIDGFITSRDYDPENSTWSEFSWIDDLSGFDDYYEAFVYSSKDNENDIAAGYFNVGRTSGLMAIATMYASPAALKLSDGTIIELETIDASTTAVPIPGTVYLFILGLIGLLTLRNNTK